MALTSQADARSVHEPLAPGAVVTPEGVMLEFQIAGVASRALAATIDVAVQVVAMIIVTIFGALVGAVSNVLGLIVTLVSIILVIFGYPVAMELMNNGRSLGRMALGTRVVTVEGAPVSFRQSLVRAFLAIVDLLFTLGGIALIFALLTPRGQRLGDIAAGTMVVRERSAAPPAEREWYRAVVNPVNINATGIGEDLYNEIRSFLLREAKMSDDARDALGTRLEQLTLRATGMVAPAGVSNVAWLSSVAAAASGQVGHTPTPGAPVTVVGWSAASSSSASVSASAPPPVPGTGVSGHAGAPAGPPPPIPGTGVSGASGLPAPPPGGAPPPPRS